MARRRRPVERIQDEGVVDVERLLAWRHHHHVPAEFLEHEDVDVRGLAEATEAVSTAFAAWAFADVDAQAARRERLVEAERALAAIRREWRR